MPPDAKDKWCSNLWLEDHQLLITDHACQRRPKDEWSAVTERVTTEGYDRSLWSVPSPARSLIQEYLLMLFVSGVAFKVREIRYLRGIIPETSRGDESGSIQERLDAAAWIGCQALRTDARGQILGGRMSQ